MQHLAPPPNRAPHPTRSLRLAAASVQRCCSRLDHVTPPSSPLSEDPFCCRQRDGARAAAPGRAPRSRRGSPSLPSRLPTPAHNPQNPDTDGRAGARGVPRGRRLLPWHCPAPTHPAAPEPRGQLAPLPPGQPHLGQGGKRDELSRFPVFTFPAQSADKKHTFLRVCPSSARDRTRTSEWLCHKYKRINK